MFAMLNHCIMPTGQERMDFTISNAFFVQDLVLFLMKKNAFVLVMAKNIRRSMLLEKYASV